MDPWWLNSECFKIIIAVSYKNVEIQERYLTRYNLGHYSAASMYFASLGF